LTYEDLLLSQVDRLSGALLGWWLWAPCASWPVRGQDNYRGPWNPKTKNPILLIGTRRDPGTPYINGVRSARRLGNAVLLTQDGYGHVSFHDPSACIDRARIAYLVRLITPPPGTVCQLRLQQERRGLHVRLGGVTPMAASRSSSA
jgi:pimeloyl-ACP methyl ester carboxylesterase